LNKQKSAGKLAGLYTDKDNNEPQKKRARVAKKTERPSVMSQFRGVDSANVKKVEISGFMSSFDKHCLLQLLIFVFF